MNNRIIPIIFFTLFSISKLFSQEFKSVEIDTLLNEKISIRAILIDTDKLWYTANNNKFGYIDLKTKSHNQNQVFNDTLKLEFRSIAQNSKAIFIANIGNPATICKINKSDLSIQKVYFENNEKVFYDSMQFWNEKEGILIGDPTEDCLSILSTKDGGNSWKKISCESLPKVVDGEAAFAASNTNVVVKGNKTWIVSGGKKARVFFTADKGKTWKVFDTPIAKGKTMTGIFTADFYNDKIGIIAGGDYEVPQQNFQNKAITTDGGKTWHLVAENSGFGYASCIQFVPNSNGKAIVSVGSSGLQYSSDGGNTWKQLATDSTLYTFRFLDEYTAFAAGKDKIIKIEFKK